METITSKNIRIARTRSGVPCLWESLVSFEELRRATIILDKHGNPKKAYYYNEEREKQALVGISIGDHVVKCFEDHHGVAISVFQIDEISSMSNYAVITPVFRKSSLISESIYPGEYSGMIKTCMSKLFGEGKEIVSHRGYELEKAI
jgi:hypothetical protein